MKKFQIGDRVTTKVAVEALYSGMYKRPEQWFTPGMTGTVVFTDSPAMRRNVNQYGVKFKGVEHGSEYHPNNTWIVRLDPKHVKAINTTITFNLIDICTPGFLQDSHNGNNECLIAIPFDTQSNYFSDKHEFAEEVAKEAMSYCGCESLWEHLPADDNEAIDLLTRAVLDEIDGMKSFYIDDENTESDEDSPYEPLIFYGYFSWTVE